MEKGTGEMEIQMKPEPIFKPTFSKKPTQAVSEKTNEYLFQEMLRKIRPDIFVLSDLIDTHAVNTLVVFKVIRQLINIGNGTHYGKISILIQNNKIISVEGTEQDSVMETVFK